MIKKACTEAELTTWLQDVKSGEKFHLYLDGNFKRVNTDVSIRLFRAPYASRLTTETLSWVAQTLNKALVKPGEAKSRVLQFDDEFQMDASKLIYHEFEVVLM